MTSSPQQPLVSVVVPAYNEERIIGTTLREAISYFSAHGMSYELIVQADGRDHTKAIAEDLARENPSIRVFGSSVRRGKGAAVKEGVAQARGRYIGYIDADNKSPISELDKFLPALERGTPVVIGSRALSGSLTGGDRPLARRIFSAAYLFFTHLVVGLWDITDTQCGYKFFHGPVAHDLFGRQRITGYVFDVEIIFLARKAKLAIEQVPIAFQHDPDSRMSVIMGNLRSLRDTVRIRFLH